MSTKVKITDPSTGKKKVYRLEDVRPFYLYDTVTANNGDTEEYFFRSPESKTRVETNLRQFSQIQIGWILDVKRIRLKLMTDITVADAKILLKKSAVTYLKEGDIEIFTIPTDLLAAGSGIYGFTTNNATDIVSLGLPSLSAVTPLPFPLTISGGKTFQFRIQWNPALSGLAASQDLQMTLEGVLRREVVGA